MTAQGWRRLLVEPRRPPRIRESPRAAWLVVATVCIGAFMGQLDASIVTVAFPTLQHDFNSSLGSVQWVGLSYLLVLIGFLAAIGRMADMVGRKLLYTYGFLIFVIGSVLSGLAPSLGALVVFRVVQGFGAAMLQANSVAIIVDSIPSSQLGRAIGVQGAAQALGLALGPGVGGLLIGLGGWRLIFFVNVPAGILGATLGWFLIPRSRHLSSRVRFDWVGLGVFVPSVCAVLLAISYGNTLGWGSAAITGLFALSAAFGFAFIRTERRVQDPMIDLKLFSKVRFSAGIASGLCSYLVLFGVLFVVPYLLERSDGASSGRAGLELMVMPLGLGLVAPVAGRLADRWGARSLTVTGMVVTAGMLVGLRLSHAHTGLFLVELALLGAGLGAFTPPNNAAIMGSAPPHQSGMASGVLNMTRGFGTSLGLALTGLIFGVFAGPAAQASSSMVAHGFDAAVYFLAGMAILAAILAGLRGQVRMNFDPALASE